MNAAILLLFARCSGFAFRAPGISYPGVPSAARAGLAVMLTLALAPAAAGTQRLDAVTFVAALALEFFIGSIIGIGASVLYDGAYAGGRAIDDYVGVKAIAPAVGFVAPSGFGRMWSLAFTGGFFLTGAYRPVILAFASTLGRLPLGSALRSGPWVLAIPRTIFEVALWVAGPAIASGFVVQVALGALSRTVPRFGSLTLTFPLVFGVALVASALSLWTLVLHPKPLLAVP